MNASDILVDGRDDSESIQNSLALQWASKLPSHLALPPIQSQQLVEEVGMCVLC